MTLISAFKNAKDTQPMEVSSVAVIEGIISGRWRNLIESVGALSEEEYKEKKKDLPCVTFSGTFSERKITGLLSYSHIVILDIDNITEEHILGLKLDLAKDEYVYAAFVSPSGKGMKVLYFVDTESDCHDAAFLHLQKYFQDKYLLKVDESGKDTSRLCFVSWDETALFNPKCLIFQVDIRYKVVKQYHSNDKFKNYEPLKDYSEVFKIVKYWIEKAGNTQIEYVEGHRNRYIHAFGCALNRVGLPLNEAVTMLQSNYDLDAKEIQQTVRKAYFQNSHEHGSVELKDIKDTVYKLPPHIANYHDDVVSNDLMIKTALLYNKNVDKGDIVDIIGKIASFYENKGFIDLNKGSLKDLMNKAINDLNSRILDASQEHSLEWQDASEIGRKLVEMDLMEGTVATFLGDIDIEMGGGMLPKSFYIAVGVGGTFKSILLQYMCYANAANGIPSLYLNGEMSNLSFYGRLGFMVLAENLTYLIRTGKVNKENIDEYIERINSQLQHNLFVVDGKGFNQENVNATLDNIKAKTGKTIRLIGIDGLTQMDSKGKEEVAAAIMNTEVCKDIAKTCNQGEGAVVVALMHVSGEQVSAKIRRDNGPFCRGGGKTIANCDGYFSTSLLVDPDTDSLENEEEVLFIPNKFYVRLVDKRTSTGSVSRILNVDEHTLHLSVEDCVASSYERKIKRR